MLAPLVLFTSELSHKDFKRVSDFTANRAQLEPKCWRPMDHRQCIVATYAHHADTFDVRVGQNMRGVTRPASRRASSLSTISEVGACFSLACVPHPEKRHPCLLLGAGLDTGLTAGGTGPPGNLKPV